MSMRHWLCVNILAVANRDHKYNQFLILDLAQYSEISDAISPQSTEICLQSFAELPGILIACYPFVQVGE